MSTKTTFKRIALVAVASLGFGVLTSVAPATAANIPVTFGTITHTPVVTNEVTTINVPFTIGATVATGDTITISSVLIAKPATATGALNSTDVVKAGTQSSATTVSSGTMTNGATLTPTYNAGGSAGTQNRVLWTVGTVTAGNTRTAVFSTNFDFTPTVAGTYTVAVFTDGSPTVAATGLIKAGDNVRYYTFTVADTTVTATSITAPWAATYSTDGANGAVLRVRGVDANGAVGEISDGQQILVTIPTGLTLVKTTGASASGALSVTATEYGLVQSDFDANGNAFLNFTASTAGFSTVTTRLAGGTEAASSATIQFKAPTGVATVGAATSALGYTNPDKTTVASVNASVAGGAMGSSVNAATVSATATSQVVTVYAAATTGLNKDIRVLVADTNRRIFGSFAGATALSTDVIVTTGTANGAATATDGTSGLAFARLTIPATLGLNALTGAGTAITVTPQSVAATTPSALPLTITSGAPLSTTAAFTSPVTTPILVATGTVNTIAVTCVDQFGGARSNVTLTPSIAGRNSTLVLPTLVTAAGAASFTYTDASTSTTSLSDVVSIAGCGSTVSTTINYIGSSTAAPSSVKITGGNHSAGVATGTITVNTIAAGTSGASGTTVPMAATVTDAAGAPIVGYPVTFTVSGTGVAITSTTQTAYTDATGVATGRVYAWTAGTYTVTATAGTASGTATVTFAQETAANARVLSATVAGNIATAKVVDRFGNPNKNVLVYVSTAGGANIGGAFATSGTTLADGTVSFVVSGEGTVSFTTTDPAAASGSNPPNQTCALAGNATCALGATAAVAFTASTVGTATTAETGVGATFAPAGVNSATVTVAQENAAAAAADAAAEATDAANAATDAANAAAEAADAATAAAQDAADAVAALSTQVTELVSALRKQITSLTNLVIKIQRKVRA
jgi:trimeric autotransporter adhesin